MALAITARAISVAFGTVSFFMVDGERTIRVDVSRDLLARMNGHCSGSNDDDVARLVRNRSRFAQIAAAKYEERQFEPEVNVLVVRIGIDDVVE